MENSNQYVLITGATSGIGYELAKKFAQEKYNLIIVARKEERLEEVAAEFSQNYNVNVVPIVKDLFQPEAAKEIYDEVKQKGIVVNILVNDAAQGQWGKFVDVDLQRHLDLIQLDIVAPVALTWYFLRDMVQRNEGKILQVGSELSKSPSPLLNVYGASKMFILSLTEALVNELKDTNVTVTLLMPGATDTDFFRKAEMEHTINYREKDLGSPEEVAADGFEALMKGDRRVVSGAMKNVAMATILPDDVAAENLRKVMEPSKKANGRTHPDHPASQREREVYEHNGQR